MLEDTAFDLGYTSFEETDQVLRMTDQSRIIPAGRLSQVPTRIGEVTYLQNFVIIRVNSGRPFPMLLDRPWLYSAKVVVDWGTREFVVGKPLTRIPWEKEKYLSETSESDGYTSGWSSPDELDSVATYLLNQFSKVSEADYGFRNPIPEAGIQDGETKPRLDSVQEERSLGEASLPLTMEWIKQQILEGALPAKELAREGLSFSLGANRSTSDEADPERIKNIVNPKDYEETEVADGKSFYLGKNLNEKEREGYMVVLKEFSDVFAWTPSDLIGIPLKLGEHCIDLIDGSVPIRQRQYMLNPKYSLMVKEEIDRLLEARFIYPVHNSEWVSPIVVVPKKVGADGKVKIRVCQDFRKLNAATKKDYFPLPFTDMILDHVSGQECYSFLDGFSGYNQVHIRDQDQLKTTFTMEWGTFAFNRMPFGLCNAPGTFQRLMMDIFQDFLRHFLEVFIDDFAVFSSRDDHLGYL